MKNYFYDTDQKLREIFSEHCELDCDQYEWIAAELTWLICDMQEAEPQAEIEKRIAKLTTVFEFLQETKEITMAEHFGLMEMLSEIWQGAIREICTEINQSITAINEEAVSNE